MIEAIKLDKRAFLSHERTRQKHDLDWQWGEKGSLMRYIFG
jgi:hypothetical protein